LNFFFESFGSPPFCGQSKKKGAPHPSRLLFFKLFFVVGRHTSFNVHGSTREPRSSSFTSSSPLRREEEEEGERSVGTTPVRLSFKKRLAHEGKKKKTQRRPSNGKIISHLARTHTHPFTNSERVVVVVVVLCLARVKEKKKTTTKNNGGGGEQRRERVSRQKDVLYRTSYRGESKIGTPPPLFRESSLVPSFDLRDEDYSVVDVNDDTQTTTT
jgi:hypothetical protein